MYGFLLFQSALGVTFFIFAIFPIISYFRDSKRLRRFPSVSVAALTNGWSILHQYRQTRTAAVHEAHQHHGDVVRIGPTYVSFAKTQAIKDMYGHGTKATKDHFYRALESTHLNVSDSQDRAVHSTKRRRFAQALAQKSIVDLEGMMKPHLKAMIAYVDHRCKNPDPTHAIDLKFVILATLYDLNSVVMFSENPKFLERDTLVCPAETITGETYTADMYQAFFRGGHVSSTVGWAPRSVRLLRALSWWHEDWKAGGEGRDITIHFLRKRMKRDFDLIKSGEQPIDDLMTTLAAGENTEIGTTNVVYLLARHPCIAKKLRQELDAALGHDRSGLPTYAAIKGLPYLRACIDEGLRLRPSIELGVPRIVSKGGMSVSGH
ncbi:hypothetical protein N7540_002334 [Penicillium herquei]|nr:hypothetical protein N7540_002334 [Penicillium herquei]